MRLAFLTAALVIGFGCSAFADERATADLIAACDKAAASPSDKNLPSGISGIDPEKIQAAIAVPACEAAAKAAPDNPRIVFELGRAYSAAKNYDAARAQYEKAMRLGNPLAANNLGSLYAQGSGSLPKDDREAARLFKIAADQGLAAAQTNLASFYQNGRGGLPKDDVEAVRLHKLAADQGYAPSQNALGIFYQNGRGGLPHDDREAARLYKLAADQGNVFAQGNLGYFYQEGRGGLAKDDSAAAHLYRLAADQGNAASQNSLGTFYQSGRGGLPRDDREAARLYKLAADKGNAHAQNNLGYFYQEGRGGLTKDDAEAARLYKLASDQGNANAQCNLGVFYANGRGGLAKDEHEAVRLYKLSADQGNAFGRYNVGLYYEYGRGGLAKDDHEAARQYMMALDRGHPNAQTALNRVQKRLSALGDIAPPVTPPPLTANVDNGNATTLVPPGRRVALVIGNSAYKSVPFLPNPVHDATTVANILRKVGFQSVVLVTDATRDKLVDALRTFAKEADNSDWAMVYYAGHGMEVGGINYLIPVDARLATDRDIQFEAIGLEQVMNATEGAKKLRLILLDACRNNPFVNQIQRSVASRSIGRGLAQVEPDAGMLVVYSAKHGQVALDGEGGANSPFVSALVKRLATPQIEIRKLFDLVRDDVMAATGRQQQPFSYGSVPGAEDFYFLTKAASRR
jgi:TPR repeat protein